MLTFAVGTLAASDPEHINDVGFFGQPGDDASKAGMTIWMPAGLYIPKSTEGAQLEAAKKFVAFVASPRAARCRPRPTRRLARTWSRAAAAGRRPQAVKDVVAYVEKGNITPALEFQSPIKGPALEQITVEVGSGCDPPRPGRALRPGRQEAGPAAGSQGLGVAREPCWVPQPAPSGGLWRPA